MSIKQSLTTINYKKLLKSCLFIILSSQLLYLTIHLQFLLGMPQAGLSFDDSLFFLALGLGLYILSKGNKIQYWIGYAVILWPTVILQYFYIKIFNKPFLLSELYNFGTLLTVSILPVKIMYVSLLIIWISGLCYLVFNSVKNWLKINLILKIIPLLIILFYTQLFSSSVSTPFWNRTPAQVFFFSGIIKTIRSRIENTNINISPEVVNSSFNLLKQYEEKRTIYPIQNSPNTIPKNKRPIFILVFESFYDYRHFLPLFEEDPFPQEYRELMNNNTYTGPNQTHGSFHARFVSLTGSIPIEPPSSHTNIIYPVLPKVLSQYGYTPIALESVTPTYGLQDYYKVWGFDTIKFHMYGNDWSGKRLDPYTFEKNITTIIQNTPDDITPFYFGFTFIGHGGTIGFTDKIDDPQTDITSFLALAKNKNTANQLLKAGIFNAERLLSIKKMILQKYPDALIILKSDHYSTDFSQFLNESDNIPQEYKDAFYNDPTPLPFVVIDGTNGVLPLEKGFSPANIPLMILAESKLPYRNTMISLLYRNVPKDMINIYNKWYQKIDGKYTPIDLANLNNQQFLEYNKAIETISFDLYKNNAPSISLELNKSNIIN